jgi:hypothetical protein
MSSFTIPRVDGADSLPVSSPVDLSRDALLAFPAFSIWLSTLQRSLARQHRDSHEFHRSPFVLRRIDIQVADFFKGGRLGFLKLKADVSNGDGESLPGSVFLRGGSVGMLVCTVFYVCFGLIGLTSVSAYPPTRRHPPLRRTGLPCCPDHPTPHSSRLARLSRDPRRNAGR